MRYCHRSIAMRGERQHYQSRVTAAQIPYAKNNLEIKEKMNELVLANLKNGKLNAIYKKYHHTDLPADVVALGN
jgi:polar amino acid transport system substrate-binding protein